MEDSLYLGAGGFNFTKPLGKGPEPGKRYGQPIQVCGIFSPPEEVLFQVGYSRAEIMAMMGHKDI
jgi:hypothetical protein